MVIAIAWIAAGAIGLVTVAVLAFGLLGQLRRFGRAVEDFRADVEPRLRELGPQAQAIAPQQTVRSAGEAGAEPSSTTDTA